MILYDYSYDLLHQPFFSRELDEKNNKISIKIIIPGQVNELAGFKIKLSKAGSPGPLGYKLGRKPGSGDIAAGEIGPEEVLPVFEAFICRKFKSIKVREGDVFFLTLTAGKGRMPLDGYRIFGPSQDDRNGFDGAESIAYWWDESYCGGMAVPKYYKPDRYERSSLISILEEDGTEGPGISLGIYTGRDEEGEGEQRFEFLRELTAPPYSEWKPVSCKKYNTGDAGSDEVVLDDTWGILWDAASEQTVLSGNIKKEIREFLNRNFSINLDSGKKHIAFKLCSEGVPTGKESHLIDVSEKGIVINAENERGLLRAVHYLEDMMLERGMPAVKKGRHTRKCLYDIRMTNGIYPAPFNYFALQTCGIWTDGYIWRLSRAGYNALWVIVNPEEIVEDSKVFPELNDPGAGAAVERLRRITDKAREYGVDVFVELRTGYFKYFPEKIYERLPGIRSFSKWGNYPCTGSDMFKNFLTETLGNLFKKANKLKGIIIIYDSEGFYSCFLKNRQEDCPVCRGKSSDVLAKEFFDVLVSSMKNMNNDAELIAWTYYCDEPWNYKLIGSLPGDVKMLSCYSQFMEFERFGVKNRTDDYACCVTGPSEYFEKVYDIAGRSGLKVLAKTEASFGQEFVGIPYVPSLTQHQKRWDSMSGKTLHGFMGDYIHRGFIPSPCTDLLRLNIFKTGIDSREWLNSSEKLRFTASLNFGKDAAGEVVKAWEFFSKAVSEYFPYSPGVCRYPGPLQAGPSQPFYLDREKKMKRNGARYNAADLNWTKGYLNGEENPEWNDTLVRRCFEHFGKVYSEGICLLENIPGSSVKNPVKLKGMINIAKIQVCMVNSMLNFIDFINLRDNPDKKYTKKEIWMELKEVCEKELVNAKEALRLCAADSNLGFSCEGQGTVRGGYFTPETISEKISGLECTIREIDKNIKQ